MKRKHRRLAVVLACGLGLGSAAALTLAALRQDIVFFMMPSDIAEKAPPAGRTIRLGGLVQVGSVRRTNEAGEPHVHFAVTDGRAAVAVSYVGIVPDLFREGQGVVALGTLNADHSFSAQEVLAKHDETYMPKDVADELKRKGLWNPQSGHAPTPAQLKTAGG